MGPNLGVVHFLATGEHPLQSFNDGAWILSVRGGVGWALTVGSLGASNLVGQAGGEAFQEGRSGPAAAVGVRLRSPLSEGLMLLIGAGLRAASIEETDFDRDEPNRRKLLLVFPVTIGLGFRL